MYLTIFSLVISILILVLVIVESPLMVGMAAEEVKSS